MIESQQLKSLTSKFVTLKGGLGLIWDFTESNFATFVLPNTAFGVFSAFAGPRMIVGYSPALFSVVCRIPLVVVYNWSNVFIFDLANQRSTESIKEDQLNKPWRPIPMGKTTSEQTRKVMLIAIPIVLALNYWLGTWKECALILILTWLYNDLKGGDEIVRDLIIATAFGFFNRGSLLIAIGGHGVIHKRGEIWIIVVSAVILTTMHIQDLKDQQGDRARGRKTIPLVFGDAASRRALSILIPLWSCCCSMFWDLDFLTSAMPLVLGIYIAFETQRHHGKYADKRNWTLWCAWTAVLYLLPAVSRYQNSWA